MSSFSTRASALVCAELCHITLTRRVYLSLSLPYFLETSRFLCFRFARKGLGKIEEIIDMPGPDKEALALQLADWDPIKRVQVKLETHAPTDWPRVCDEFAAIQEHVPRNRALFLGN